MSQDPRQLARTVDYIEDLVGADIPRDLLKVAIVAQDLGTLKVESPSSANFNADLDSVGDVDQTGEDWTQLFKDIAKLENALSSTDSDQIVVRVEDSNGNKIDPATDALNAALKSNDTDELIARVTDSTGAEVNPATQALEDALISNDSDTFVVRVTDPDGTEVRPLEDDVTSKVATNSVRTQVINPLAQDYKVANIIVDNGDIWQIESSKQEEVNNVTVDGSLILEGTLTVYGEVTGNGTITGGGTIEHAEI